jgi:hypothetical protein
MVAIFILGLIGMACKSQFGKHIFTGACVISFASLAGEVVYGTLDLSMCQGSFVPMITCPPEVERSFKFDLARLAFGLSFFGMLAAVFVFGPLMIVASIVEIKARWKT